MKNFKLFFAVMIMIGMIISFNCPVWAGSAFLQTEAESFSSMNGINTESCSEGGQNIGWIENGDYTAYNGIDFGTGAGSFKARVASAGTGGTIEIRLGGSTGTLIGTCTVPGTGGWQSWITVGCNITNTSGVQNLFLVYSGGINVNWFSFSTEQLNNEPVMTYIGAKIVNPGTAINFTVNATDANTEDTLVYTATAPAGTLPSGAVFNTGTRAFNWTPSTAQLGTYSIRFSVTDGKDTAYEDVTIIVRDPSSTNTGAIIADHQNAKLANLMAIPDAWITKAKTDLHIYYNHTSHGSQVSDGMSGLATFKGSKYAWSGNGNGGGATLHFRDTYSTDLGNGSWTTITEDYLKSNTSTNVVMWSWCGQVSGASATNINNYLNAMNQLEIKYPAVKFIYMTGHTDGTGINGTLNTRNEQIRTYCRNNNKILFDFADIESYDPDGNYYLNKAVNDECWYDSDANGSRDRNWATDWQNSHTENVEWYRCGSAHSQPINANMKAYAAWYMWARIAGWDGTSGGGGSVNQAPVLAGIGSKTVNEGSSLTFTIGVTDPDIGAALSYTAATSPTGSLPSGASFNATTRTFNWTPGFTQSGTYTLRFTVTDGALSDYEDVTVTVNNVNRPPVLAAIGAKLVKEGSLLSLTISGTDPDTGTTLTYSAATSPTGSLPAGANFNPGTRTFNWTPSNTQSGTYTLRFTVSDGSLSDYENVVITVADETVAPPPGGGNSANNAPVLNTIGAMNVEEETLLSFIITAADPDANTTLTYSAIPLIPTTTPAGASFNAATKTFNWIPNNMQSGSYTIRFLVSDGELIDYEDVIITVNNKNQPPVLSAIGAKTVNEGSPLNFSISAADPDTGASLVFSATTSPTGNLPAGASFNPNTRTFNWVPTYSQSGTYTLRFMVSDGALSDSETVTITVNDITVVTDPIITPPAPPAPPVAPVVPITPITPAAGSSIELSPVVSGDIAKASLSEDQVTNAFSQATADAAGIKTVTLNVAKATGAKTYMQEIPAAVLENGTSQQRIEINTSVANITIPGNMFTAKNTSNIKNMGISVSYADKSGLQKALSEKIGDRPVIVLTAYADNKKIPWSNSNAPVTIALDYEPTAEELKNPDHIVVWYIDGKGKVIEVPSGRYDPVAKKVIFTTTHFSQYAVTHSKKTYHDIEKAYAKTNIEALASKGLFNWIEGDSFNPSRNITRGEFIYLLVTALDLHGTVDSNFSDVDTTDVYYEAAGIAKKLGISNGMGNNQLGAKRSISRQDMSTLIIRALKVAKKNYPSGNVTELSQFNDAGRISNYAKESLATLVKAGVLKGYNKNLDPRKTFTMQEAATVIYRIYNK